MSSPLRKMILVPETAGSQFQSSARIYGSHQSRLDQDMNDIVNRTDLSIDEKWKLYQQALHRYLQHTSHLQKPITLPIIEEQQQQQQQGKPEPQADSDNSTLPLVGDILNSVPQRERVKTELLLKYLMQSKKISWTRDAVVSIHGQTLAGSNIIDLINDVVRNRKFTRNPAGIQQFIQLLQDLNVPKQYYNIPFKFTYKEPEGEESPGKTQKKRTRGRKPYTGRRRKVFEDWEDFEF